MNLEPVLMKRVGRRAVWFGNEMMIIKRVGSRGRLERRMEVPLVG